MWLANKSSWATLSSHDSIWTTLQRLGDRIPCRWGKRFDGMFIYVFMHMLSCLYYMMYSCLFMISIQVNIVDNTMLMCLCNSDIWSAIYLLIEWHISCKIYIKLTTLYVYCSWIKVIVISCNINEWMILLAIRSM